MTDNLKGLSCVNIGNWFIDWETRSSYIRLSNDNSVLKVTDTGKFLIKTDVLPQRIIDALPPFCFKLVEELPFVEIFDKKRLLIK